MVSLYRVSLAAIIFCSQSNFKGLEIPKGHLAIYVRDKMGRFVIPESFLDQPYFQELVSRAEEEFGYDHPAGGLTFPCKEDEFLNLTSLDRAVNHVIMELR